MIVIVGAVAAFLLVQRLTQADPATAREWLNQGALVIDVRSEAEFQERHLPGAINLPLDRLGDEIAGALPTSNSRCCCIASAGPKRHRHRALKKLGYHNVFNLGSYGRAEKILAAQPRPGRRISRRSWLWGGFEVALRWLWVASPGSSAFFILRSAFSSSAGATSAPCRFALS